jgi:hypothetical protein
MAFQPQGGTEVQLRRFFLAAACLFPFGSQAQPAFIGQWQGEVEGIGKARLIITAIKADGQIEGRMEFDLLSFVSTFADKADSAENTNYGVVSGTALRIDSALGGKYDLVLNGTQLSGTYSRGTSLRSQANFKKI